MMKKGKESSRNYRCTGQQKRFNLWTLPGAGRGKIGKEDEGYDSSWCENGMEIRIPLKDLDLKRIHLVASLRVSRY
jgi:hypothetical protein